MLVRAVLMSDIRKTVRMFRILDFTFIIYAPVGFVAMEGDNFALPRQQIIAMQTIITWEVLWERNVVLKGEHRESESWAISTNMDLSNLFLGERKWWKKGYCSQLWPLLESN